MVIFSVFAQYQYITREVSLSSGRSLFFIADYTVLYELFYVAIYYNFIVN